MCKCKFQALLGWDVVETNPRISYDILEFVTVQLDFIDKHEIPDLDLIRSTFRRNTKKAIRSIYIVICA
jgi:hypothetical protein